MPRLHLFEFGDQAWLPAPLRAACTGYLDTVSRLFGLHRPMAAIVDAALRASGAARIVDLGTGSGRTMLCIGEHLSQPASIVLTDRFPDQLTADAAGRPDVTVLDRPVDAVSPPAELTGLRTLINGFHHFRPLDARRILEDAAARRMPILVLEMSERSVANVLGSPLIVILVLLLMPFVRPLRRSFLVFTYLIPVLPLMIFWDGLVSHLRTYSVAELAELVEGIGGSGYEWEVRRSTTERGLRATVLRGHPVARS